MSRSKNGSTRHATFSFGPEDQDRIEELRKRLGHRGHLLNRSEVVRLALMALASQSETTIDSVVEQLERLRPGRVRKGKGDRR